MQEAKFRAWDKKRKIMTYSKNMNNLETFFNYVECVNYRKLMQYTGLHDNNGKEIYEGDIVLVDWEMKKVHQTYKIEWIQSGFKMTPMNINIIKQYPLAIQEKYIGELIDKCLKIIGNIYQQNPELLCKTT